MSSTTKIYEEKMNNCVAHLDRELTSIGFRSPHPDHHPLGWYPDQGNLQGNPDQRYRHQPH